MKRILVIVDMQNDFIDGSLGTPEAQAMVPVMEERLREYEDGETLVILTKDTHPANYLETREGKHLPVEHCIEGTPGWSISKKISQIVDHGNFAKISSDSIINGRVKKETFGSTYLPDVIGAVMAVEDIEEIVFMGLCTDICVVSNVLICKAVFPEAEITVDASCCAGVTPESHKAALTTMRMCQVNIINEEDGADA
jgi:nicotinamidase-related amidase